MAKGLILTLLSVSFCVSASAQQMTLEPAKNSRDVCIDTHLVIDFPTRPRLGTSGLIRIYDADNGRLVDSLDISIPAGQTASRTYSDSCDYLRTPYSYARTTVPTNLTCRPGTPSHPSAASPEGAEGRWQLNIIGGFTDGFHFHPVLVRGNKAVIYPHNNVLQNDRRYLVTVDKEVFVSSTFRGISRKDGWTFSTKSALPAVPDTLTVSADGNSDFRTLQGALDFIPDFSARKTVILVAPGDYEEIVYVRNKTNITIIGSGMDKTCVHYANNEVFNPHPLFVKTNELPRTFPSRRAAVAFDNCHDIVLRDITFATDLTGQAEGLLLNGTRIALVRVHVVGSGDALQANGTVYMSDCEIDGGGDTILGRGSLFARNCRFRNDGGPFTWVRNTMGHHGDVFVDCTFSCPDGRQCDYGRTPNNHGKDYPYAELVVINCKVRNLAPSGWGTIGQPTEVMLEYNTRDLDTGNPVDISRRHPYSRQLSAEKDAALIQSYSNPAFVLGGWTFSE